MSRVDDFVNLAVEMANNPAIGYSQINRWGSSVDCSSLVYRCASQAGYAVGVGSGWTGTMIKDFTDAGWDWLPRCAHDYIPQQRGDVLLNYAYHTAIYIGDNKLVHAAGSETGGIDGQPGDQTGKEVCVDDWFDYPWDGLLRPPLDAGLAPAIENKTGSGLAAALPPKSNLELALEVIRGDWGVYPKRKERLEAAGFNYFQVQDKVNELMGCY